MMPAEVIGTIAAHQDELRRMGVASLAVFGSVARGDATDGSDIDLLIEFNRRMGLFGFIDIQMYLESLLGTDKIDLVQRHCVLDELKERIYAEAVPCFSETGSSVSVTS